MPYIFEFVETGRKLIVDQPTLLVGSLGSNQIVLEGIGIEPIHAVLERIPEGFRITDLGSETGILVNAKKIDVEQLLKPGDVVTIMHYHLRLIEKPADFAPPPTAEYETVSKKPIADRRSRFLLFKPRESVASGHILEIVNYWDDRILDIDHFHPNLKGFTKAIIGRGEGTHFISASEKLDHHVLAHVSKTGYTLHLADGMSARLRTKGEARQVGPGHYQLGQGDIAHVSHRYLKYFCIFMQPPELKLPKEGLKDPLFFGLFSFAILTCLSLSISFSLLSPNKELHLNEQDKAWSVVHVPEKIEPPVTKPKIEVKKEKPAKPKPPELTVKPISPVKEKLPEAKPAPQPKPPAAAPMENLTKAKTQVASPQVGQQGSLMPQRSVATEVKKPSGVNLSQLGLGAGLVSTKQGPSAVYTNLKSSGGSVSNLAQEQKMLGTSGVKVGQTIGFGSAQNTVATFGGQTISTHGIGTSFKGERSGVNVDVRAGDPLVSGGLTQEEIEAVIRMHLNEVRACYEKLLQSSPSSSGKIKVNFIIDLSGHVSSKKVVSSELSDSNFQTCVLSKIQTWIFPNPRGGSPVTVNKSFTLLPL